MEITLQPIGIIHSPFEKLEGMPIQPKGAIGTQGKIVLFDEFEEGIRDLDGFSHAILLYYFHKVSRTDLTVTPFLDKTTRGVFSTRAPTRPNHIGISVVEITQIDGLTIHIRNIDTLNGTPLIDIKPYVPEFDHFPTNRTGWFGESKSKLAVTKSDKRFQ